MGRASCILHDGRKHLLLPDESASKHSYLTQLVLKKRFSDRAAILFSALHANLCMEWKNKKVLEKQLVV